MLTFCRGAGLSTKGLYHYPASITNSTLAKTFALFGTTTGFTSNTVAGVINNFGNGRQQVRCEFGRKTNADQEDGIFPRICYRLEFNIDYSTTCMDTLGNKRTM